MPDVLCSRPVGFFLLLCLLLCAACHQASFLPVSSLSRTSGLYHTVEKGQTLWRICQAYQVSMQEVAELNNITDPSQIRAGDRLFIPGVEKVLQVPVTAAAPRAPTPSPRPSAVPARPEPAAPAIKRSTGMFIWPVQGTVIKRFGIQGGLKHDGIDIRAAARAEIRAARAGRVMFADRLEGYGSTVIVQHDGGFVTVYANLGDILVDRDQQVRQSQALGRLMTGPPEKVFLHFQVRRDKQARNPLFYLPDAR